MSMDMELWTTISMNVNLGTKLMKKLRIKVVEAYAFSGLRRSCNLLVVV